MDELSDFKKKFEKTIDKAIRDYNPDLKDKTIDKAILEELLEDVANLHRINGMISKSFLTLPNPHISDYVCKNKNKISNIVDKINNK